MGSIDGKLDQTLAAGYYLNTVQMTDNGQPVRLAPGLDPAASTLQLTNTHIVISGQDLYLRPFVLASDPGRRFQLTYIYGPAPILARLRVQLSTSDRTTTPVFTGASLEVV